MDSSWYERNMYCRFMTYKCTLQSFNTPFSKITCYGYQVKRKERAQNNWIELNGILSHIFTFYVILMTFTVLLMKEDLRIVQTE